MRIRICVLLLTTATVGCAKPTKQAVAVSPALVRWHDVADTTTLGVRNDYVRLRPGPTENLFPASLAIAETLTFTGSADGTVVPSPLAKPRVVDQIDWTELFDDQWQIAKTFPLPFPGADGHTVSPSELVVRARDVQADLCLVYRVGGSGLYTAQARGALYDTRSGEILAGIHCEETVDPIKAELAPTPAGSVEGDLRNVDPKMLVMDRFREVVRRCVLDLIATDRKTDAAPVPFGRQEPTLPAKRLRGVSHRG